MGVPTGLEALLVDLDGTLVDSHRGRADALHALDELCVQTYGSTSGALLRSLECKLAELWQSSPFAAEFEELGFVKSDVLWSSFEGASTTMEAIRDWAPSFRSDVWTSVSRELGIPDRGAEFLARSFVDERESRVRAFEGTRSALQALSTRFRLALVSNGPADLQRTKLARSDLSGFFDRVIISGEVGVAKPRAGIFTSALESLGCAPQGAIMIGDDWRNDVDGAKRAGIDAIFVARERVAGSDGSSADRTAAAATVECFADVPAVLMT
jgi:putative hydrolase of the HAD superfamily